MHATYCTIAYDKSFSFVVYFSTIDIKKKWIFSCKFKNVSQIMVICGKKRIGE
jgi:hypothetical protein